jgi:hypothetical protein
VALKCAQDTHAIDNSIIINELLSYLAEGVSCQPF